MGAGNGLADRSRHAIGVPTVKSPAPWLSALVTAVCLTACGGGTDGNDGVKMLVQASAEPAGINCAEGGQRLQAGADMNGDDQLQDSEVQLTTFACNGPTASVRFDITTIAKGDARCAEGGTLVSIDSNSTLGTRLAPFCNAAAGTAGPKGSPGAVGLLGAAGLTGVAGPAGFDGPAGPVGSDGAGGSVGIAGPTGPASAAPLPTGQFQASQIVMGAILTCTSTGLAGGGAFAACDGMKLNGLSILDGDPGLAIICASITGSAIAVAMVQGDASDPHYTWNGSAWEPQPGTGSQVWLLGCLR